MIRNERTRGLFLAVLMVLAVFGGAIAVTGSAFAVDSATDNGLTAQSNHGQVSNLNAPATATAGETITVTADVTNTNATAETFEVEFLFGGDVLLNQSVMIGGGNTTEVSFNVPTAGVTPGTYTHGVQAGGASQTVGITIQQPPTFEVSNLSAPATAAAGDTITVTADVTNTNATAETVDAEFFFAGNVLLNQSVMIGGGNTTEVSFNVPTTGIAPGTYTHGVQAGDSNQTADITIQQPATFEVSNLGAPATAVAGDTITVTADVSNVGGTSGTTDAEFVFAGDVLLNQSVALDAGNSTGVSFNVSTSGVAPGTYTHGVQAGDSNQTADITIQQPATFEVSNLSAPATATAGDTITVTADVTNVGDVSGTTDAEFVFAGDVLLNETVALDGGNATEVSFNVPTTGVAPGTYTHGVQAGDSSQTADITIQQPAAFEVSDLSAPATATAGDTITVSATVSNVGDISGTTDAEFFFAGNVLLNETVALDGGNATEVSFDVPTSGIATGTYTHGVQAGDSNQTAQIEISQWSLDALDRDVIRGDLTEFDVTFDDGNAGEAYLIVGLQTDDFETSYGYEANITIRDDPNSSSRTGTIVFNTYEAGSVTGNVPPVTAEGGIEIVSIEETANTAGVIQPTTDADGNTIRDPYPIRFGTESVDQAYTNPNTTGGLDLISRETVDPTLNTWTAPASEVSDLESASGADIAQMAADGELTPVGEAPSGGIARSDRLTGDFDALVYQVQAPGIQGFLETRTGTTEDALIAADALALTQSNPFFNQAPKRLNLTNDASGLTITRAAGTDTYFIVVNADQLNLSRDTNLGTIPFGSPQVGETYDVQFSINDQVGTLSASDDPTNFVEAGFQLNPANINNDGDFEIRIQNEFDVSGTTGLAPGTEFDIVIEDQLTPGSFMFVDNATVDENGEFSAEYAPQNVPASGSEFELQITVPDFPSAAGIREDGLFREQPTANVTFNDQTRIGGDLVVIESGDLSDGGYIAIHEGGPGGPIVGHSKLQAPGSFNNLPIALDFNESITENSTLVAMPHFDRPADGFFRFDGQNDSFYYLTEPVAPSDLPPEGQRTPVTDSAEITYIPQEQQEITRTIINTVEVPVDVTRTVTVPVTRTVEVPVEVTRTVIRDRTVEVTRTVTRTVEVVEEVTVTRTVEVVEEVTRTVEVTRTIINTEEVTRTITIINNVTDTPNGQPGLGALVAVIALLAASLLAARRRDW